MSNAHINRLSAPKTWQIKRKGTKYIAKPLPGPHKTENSMPISTIFKESIDYARNTREVKKILHTNEIKIDGITRKDTKFPVGIFDVMEFSSTGEYFRIILNKKGKIDILKIKKDEASIKPCKITGKTMVNGKVQLNLYDGKNITVDKDSFKVGDTVFIELPGQKISKHVKLDKKSTIFLIGGKHIGETGHVEDISKNKIIYKNKEGEIIETSKAYAFVVGDSKPLITIE